ncbi:MAG: FtsX-like permease family protein [Ectobacillus sp.]
MFLALRELRYAKLRYTLIALIMILIAWLTFIVSGLANGLASDNASAIESMNGHSFVLQKEAEQKIGRSSLPETALTDIQKQVGTNNAVPLSQMMVSLKKENTTKKIDATIFGINPSSFLAPDVTEGSSLSEGAILSKAFKEKGIQVGDVLTSDDLEQTFVVAGFTDNQMFSHTPVMYVPIKQFQVLQTSMGKKEISYNAIVLKKEAGSLEKSVSGIQVLTKSEMVQSIPGYKEEQGSLTMMRAFLVIIAAFVQAGFFYVLTLQKTNQFGVLKAIGATTSYLAKSVIGQVLLLAVAAIAASLALTFGASMLFPAGMPFVLSTSTIVQYSVLLLLVSALGASLSLYQIARIDAMEAIGRAE